MQRSTLVALPLCLVLLSQTGFQARASPVPRNFHPLKDSSSGCLTVIFLALSLTILFIFKKIYVNRRRKIDNVIFSDEFSAPTSSLKEGRFMAKAIAKKSGFCVGLLGSPGWETKHSVLIGSGPGHISLPPESHTASCRRVTSRSSTTTVLHKVPARCEITSTRPAPSNVFGDKLQPLHISALSPELSHPPPAMLPPKCPSPCFHTNASLRTSRLSSPLITQVEQHGDFQTNGNITLNLRNLTSGLNSLRSRTDQSEVSSLSSFADFKDERRLSNTYAADIVIPTQTFRTLTKHATDLLENNIQQSAIKPLHFGSVDKRCAHTISENSQQAYGDNANGFILETAARDFSAVSPPKASHKIPDPPKFCRQFADLSSNSVRLKPQCSTPSKWTRNSPIIGPSPLRTMSLPSDYDVDHIKKFNANDRSTLSNIRSEAKFEPSSDSPRSSSPISKRYKTVLQANDPDIILDLIRELAQETSAWDASLFLNENFKAMMDQSKTHPGYKLKIPTAQDKWSEYRRKQRRMTPFIPLQDIPEFDGVKCNSYGLREHMS